MVMSPATWANNNAYRVCPSNAKRREQSGKRLGKKKKKKEEKKKSSPRCSRKITTKRSRLVPKRLTGFVLYTYTARATWRRWCSIVERDIRSYIGSKYVTAPVGCKKNTILSKEGCVAWISTLSPSTFLFIFF